MVKHPKINSGGKKFSKQDVADVWEKAKSIPGKNKNLYRKIEKMLRVISFSNHPMGKTLI